jgi:hypothetical protein
LKILGRNKFAVHPFFIPKVIFITSAIFLGIPFRWYERLKFKTKIQKQKINDPVFILGHLRSGTTYIHYLLSKDPQFSYCTTNQAILPHLFLTGSGIISPMIAKALPKYRPMDNLKMGSEKPKEEDFALASFGPESLIPGFYFPKNYYRNFLKDVVFENNPLGEIKWKNNFDFFLKKLSFAGKGKTLLLKSPSNTARVKQILELYPNAKFIHIHRNPYEVYASTCHLFEKMLPILSFQKPIKEELEKDILAVYSDLYKKYFLEKKRIPPGNLVEIDYKVFTEKPLESLQNIYKKLNIEGFEKATPFIEAEIKSYKDYQTNKLLLSEETKKNIAKNWGFAFKEMGYSK